MRIVGGKNRHRIIKWPADSSTRPTKDMVREGLFSALGVAVHDASILDLFAGSGALALEALSRGAKDAVLVDKSAEAIRIIRENIIDLKIENAVALKLDYEEALIDLSKNKKLFDIIFLDPPYLLNRIEEITAQILDSNLLSKDGIIIVETDYEISLEDARFAKVKQYKYGKTLVTIKWR